MTEENIAVEAAEDVLIFSTSDCVLYARTMDGIEDFPADDIVEALNNTEYSSICKVKRISRRFILRLQVKAYRYLLRNPAELRLLSTWKARTSKILPVQLIL